MESIVARRTWRTLEPIHGLVYFAPEATQAYAHLGLPSGQGAYFASRGAALGAVPAEVVIATFFNFNPALVSAAVPAAWSCATPERILAARLAGARTALRARMGEAVQEAELVEAAAIARRAAEVATQLPEGRPLFAAHAALPWPDDPLGALWHAQTLLREFRGDGHVAALTVEGVDGIEALVLHGATGDVAPTVLKRTRGWPDDAWAAAEARLRVRGWLDDAGGLTETGRAHRQWVEDRTDALALPPYAAVGEEACDRLRELARPWSRAIVASGAFGFRTS